MPLPRESSYYKESLGDPRNIFNKDEKPEGLNHYVIRYTKREFNINTSDSPEHQKNNPLHGISLETMLNELVEKIGWIEMNKRVQIDCFYSHPSIKSSLKFLRRTNWARVKVEIMYLEEVLGLSDK